MSDARILDNLDVHDITQAAASVLPEGQGDDIRALATSHELLRAALYDARERAGVRCVFESEDMQGADTWGVDDELPDHYALTVGERHSLVGTLDVLAAVAHEVLAYVARERAR